MDDDVRACDFVLCVHSVNTFASITAIVVLLRLFLGDSGWEIGWFGRSRW